MKIASILIANLRCSGCVHTITQSLSGLPGVENVSVDLETNGVTVSHVDTVSRLQLTQRLLSLGYPETTEKNGILTQLKSVGSCLNGKLTNLNTPEK